MPGTARPTPLITSAQPMAAQKRPRECVPDLPQNRVATDHSRVDRDDDSIAIERDTTTSMPMTGRSWREQHYPLYTSSITKARGLITQPAPHVLHHQDADATSSQHIDPPRHVSLSRPQMKPPARSLQHQDGQGVPQTVSPNSIYQPQQYLGSNTLSWNCNVAPSPGGQSMRMGQARQPPPPFSPPQHNISCRFIYGPPGRQIGQNSSQFITPQHVVLQQRATARYPNHLPRQSPTGSGPPAYSGQKNDVYAKSEGTAMQQAQVTTSPQQRPAKQYPPLDLSQQSPSATPLPEVVGRSRQHSPMPTSRQHMGNLHPISFFTLKPRSQVIIAEVGVPRWSKTDLTKKICEVATTYLTTITPQLEPHKVLMVPGIPESHSHASIAHLARFAPDHIWLLRHLDPVIRFQEYVEFVRLGRKMRDSDQSKDEYWNSFFTLQARTKMLHKAEKDKLLEFAEQSGESETPAQARSAKRAAFIDACALGCMLSNTNGRWSAHQFQNSKRGPEDDDEVLQPPPVKKDRKGNTDEAMMVTDDEPALEPLKTGIRDQMNAHKNGDELDRRARYNLLELELSVGAGSCYAWESYGQEAIVNAELNEAKAPAFAEKRTWFSDEVNNNLEYWKRKYKGDRTRLPDHPSLDLKDYSRRADGRFPCNHTASACVAGICHVTSKNGNDLHHCCKYGYDDRGKKASIRKGVNIFKSQVEAGIDKGLLSSRHRFWEKAANNRIKRKEKDAKISTQASKEGKGKTEQCQREPAPRAPVPPVRNASSAIAQTASVLLLSAAQIAETQESQHKLQQEEVSRKLEFQRYQEEHKKLREQERAEKLPSLQKKKDAALKKYLRLPNNIGKEYFQAWWDAFGAEELGDALTDEQKEWRNRPSPEWAKLKDVPKSLTTPAPPAYVPCAPENQPEEYDDLFYDKGDDGDET